MPTEKKVQEEKYICTECGKDATIAYSASKPKHWNGLVKIGERLCMSCGRKRGINFFGKSSLPVNK